MPQLNPSPWLMIMGASWMMLLVLYYPKAASALPQNTPLPQDQTPHKTNPWNWPWV